MLTFSPSIEFHILGTGVSSSLFKEYDPATPTLTIMYGPSQFGWNFPTAWSVVFSKTLLKTRSSTHNARDFTCMLYRFVSLCRYDAIHTVVASQSSSVIFKSLVMAATLAFSRILAQSVGTPISIGIMASIP